MLKRKTVAWIAVTLVVIFGVTVVVYPLIYNPNSTDTSEASPANMPVAPVGP